MESVFFKELSNTLMRVHTQHAHIELEADEHSKKHGGEYYFSNIFSIKHR